MSFIAHIAILVRDYDEAIDFYVRQLDFVLVEDTIMSETKRWVLVQPKGNGACQLLLAKAVGEEQEAAVGNQSGGRVFLFLHTHTFDEDLERIRQHQIKIVRGPIKEDYGDVVVFEDLYGNKWDLIGKNE